MQSPSRFLVAATGLFLMALALSAAEIDAPSLHFSVSAENGDYSIRDKSSGVAWRSHPERFGEVTLNVSGKSQRIALVRPTITSAAGAVLLEFRPLTNQAAAIRVNVQALPDNQTLEFNYSADPALNVESIRLLDEALWTTDEAGGYVVVPVREGLFVPADSGLSFTQRFDTYAYEGCHMQMLGVVQNGVAALVTWDDPYVTAELRSALTSLPATTAKQVLSISLALKKTATAFRIRVLGKGDYLTIAKAYRDIAKARGLLMTWDEKLKQNPARAKYFGASNYKLWSTLSRRMNEDSTKEERMRVNWTFDEAAQVAEHLKNDLRLDKILFMMGGWIHRGYDNQHPDILPTAPECGGDTAFADACRRIRGLGYLLSLHDNYQDIYRDSPSWNERWVQKKADGQLTQGGHWDGGLAYITCSKMALELAQRPQNLRAVKQLSGADSYFIDTTYAAGLQECFDKEHPLTRADDMKWKQALSDYGTEVFGSFGSECGREWAIPHADFFEGMTGVSGGYYHKKDLVKNLGASVIPLFELVYRDCIAMYGKYGYDPTKAADYVLHHIAIGRTLNYHIIPPHLYWKGAPSKNSAPTGGVAGDPALFTRADQGWAEGLHIVDRFVKNTHEILSPLNEITARVLITQHEFLTPDRKVQRTVFGSGTEEVEVVVNSSASDFRHRSTTGGDVVLPPFGFVIESRTFVAFCATTWNGRKYPEPTLFTLRGVDDEPLESAKQVRVFHAFGEPLLQWKGALERIATERLVDRNE